MLSAITNTLLKQENQIYSGTYGVSQENKPLGFVPAFYDRETGRVYRSCWANGNPAPVHVLAGLPDVLITKRSASGLASATKVTVVSGFLLGDQFYTREQAAKFSL